MATVAQAIKPKKRPRIRRRKAPNLVVFLGSREVRGEEADELLRHVSQAVAAKQRIGNRYRRIEQLPEQRRSVARAMLVVEERLVKAFWILERSTEASSNGFSTRHGIDYLREEVDQFLAGRWLQIAPRPALPEGRHIDDAIEIQGWLTYLEPTLARVLTIGAMSKRGDAGRKINWLRVRSRLPELADIPQRTLQHYYSSALREIVVRLTEKRIANA